MVNQASLFEQEGYLHRFKADVNEIALPDRFNYPFHYVPHSLAVMAADEVQQHLLLQSSWVHDFGIHQRVNGSNIGKMFGVLVVRDRHGDLGYLAAFSGKLAGTNHLPGFVPPVVDLLDETGFYRRGEALISEINHQIKCLESSFDLARLKEQHQQLVLQLDAQLADYRQAMKQAKKLRDAQREVAQGNCSSESLDDLKARLKNESLKWQYDLKVMLRRRDEQVDQSRQLLDACLNKIQDLMDERKTRSAALQQQMFDCYAFLDARGLRRNLRDIFSATELQVPPAGAGDCAAPKLLQYAYLHGLQPVTMAEFWWGQSPASEVRRHGHFYPSCNSKCKPILGHMLQGLSVDPNPVLATALVGVEPQIIYDDDVMAVVNKPAEYLSVPGKTEAPSVFTFVRNRYPQADGPLMVHRLDMSTSGLIVIAKNMQAYHHLQNQFQNHLIRKRYVALLDGVVPEERGVVQLPLRVDLDDRPRQLVCFEHGKPSVTHWRVIGRGEKTTRVHFFPLTGRTHQLRMHAAHSLGLNCPIVGDDLYGQPANRLHLHAETLELVHPVSGSSMKFFAPPDF